MVATTCEPRPRTQYRDTEIRSAPAVTVAGFLVGWNSIAAYCKVKARCAKRWHSRCPMPIGKIGRMVRSTPALIDRWLVTKATDTLARVPGKKREQVTRPKPRPAPSVQKPAPELPVEGLHLPPDLPMTAPVGVTVQRGNQEA